METKTKVIIGGVVVLAIVAGYYFWTKKPKIEDVKAKPNNNNNVPTINGIKAVKISGLANRFEGLRKKNIA
jgi:regulatory protein YycH of two-component signal transduction system YycFG